MDDDHTVKRGKTRPKYRRRKGRKKSGDKRRGQEMM